MDGEYARETREKRGPWWTRFDTDALYRELARERKLKQGQRVLFRTIHFSPRRPACSVRKGGRYRGAVMLMDGTHIGTDVAPAPQRAAFAIRG